MNASTFDAAFQRVQELAATFKANEARYLYADYQEPAILDRLPIRTINLSDAADKVYGLTEVEIAIVENAQK